MKPPLVAALAGLLAAFAQAEPLFDVVDCSGVALECSALFPGSRAAPDAGWWGLVGLGFILLFLINRDKTLLS